MFRSKKDSEVGVFEINLHGANVFARETRIYARLKLNSRFHGQFPLDQWLNCGDHVNSFNDNSRSQIRQLN
jgi:hypothetical protein